MLIKAKVLEIVNDFPDEFPLEDLIEKLIILDKIDIGLQQVKEDHVMTTLKLKKKLKKWLK